MHHLQNKGGLYIVDVQFPYKDGSKTHEVQFVLDTGAAITIIDTDIVDFMGYSAKKDGIHKSTLDGAGGRSVGYVIRVPYFKCLGAELQDFEIACHDMDSRLGVAGLLGMNFLKHFHIDLNFKTGAVRMLD